MGEMGNIWATYKAAVVLGAIALPLAPIIGTTAASAQAPAPGSAPPPPQDIPEEPIRDSVRPGLPERFSDPPQPGELPPADDLLAPPATEDAPAGDLPVPPDNIVVRQFNIVGSTVFSEETLAELVEEFTNRPITFPELLQARSAITQHYVDAGYITSGAFVPAGQRIVDGVITIQVVEGELEDIALEGLKRLNDSYVTSRIRRAAGTPLNVPKLVEGLQLLQLDPRIETISAELAAGSGPGQSVLDVRVAQARDYDVFLQADNGRSPGVGTFRQRISLSYANVFDGIGDEFQFTFTNTSGSDEFQFRYSVPLTASNTRLTLSFRDADSNIVEAPFDELNIESNSELYEATLVQPLRETSNESVLIGLSFTHQDSDTFLDGDPFPFVTAADTEPDDDLGTAVSALRFFQEWTRRSQREVFAARSSFNVGISAFDSTETDSGPDSNFFTWQGQAQYVRRLAPDTLLLVRANTQLASEPLLALEQFGTGGAGSVRGYRQDALITDSGVFASAEVRFPVARIPKWDTIVWVAPFFDYGRGNNLGDIPDPDTQNLASLGVSLRLQVDDWLSANLDFGVPLIDIEEGDTLQEDGLLFSISIQPLEF